MLYLSIFAILFGILLISNPAFGYTASKFFSDYGEDLSIGQKIKVLVEVKGEPESENPAKRAKEIRYLQSAVLKFCNFAGATNVKSDSWNNEFTAIVTKSLAKVLEERSDVISVKVIESSSTAQTEISIPEWAKNNAGWWAERLISDEDFASGIQYMIKEGIIQVPTTSSVAEKPEGVAIPDWVRNNADWWSKDLISDKDFALGIQYLVMVGIISV